MASTNSAEAISLLAAIQGGKVEFEFQSNGKDLLSVSATNSGARAVTLQIPAGQLFVSPTSTVALLRSSRIALPPRSNRRVELPTVATNSANVTGKPAPYEFSAAVLPNLKALFAHLDAHPEISPGAAQVAVLALTENIPLGAVAEFDMQTGGVASKADNPTFKSKTSEIVEGLLVLRAMGTDGHLALKVNPQLKIEAMIDPTAHALAVRYFNITDEWAYWRSELLDGENATRHYALYGIARFFPDVALEMLPKWARESKTSMVFRVSAVQALTETQRPEALAILRQLANEFGVNTEIGRTAHLAANVLDAQFAQSPRVAVAFRAAKGVTQ